MEWILKLLDYGALGIVCLVEGEVIRRLYRRVQALEEQRAETNKKMALEMIAAIRSKGREPRSISPSPTSYSIATSSKPTRD